MKHLLTQSYYLQYAADIQVQHIRDIKHLESTHKTTLMGLQINNICKLKNIDCVGFTSSVKNPFLRLFRRKETTSFVYKISPFLYKVDIDGNYFIFFYVLPMTATSHLFIVSVYANKINSFLAFLVRPILEFAVKLTIYEDLDYYVQRQKDF